MSTTKTPADRRLQKTSTPGVYRRGNRYVVRFRDGRGKPHKRSARTLAEARDLKASLATDVRRGEYREDTKVSFADYARSWIETYDGRTARGIRASTLRDYRRTLGLRIEEDGALVETGEGAIAFFGRTPLASIRPQDVKEYAASVAATGAARNTVRLALAPVKACLATAFEEGLIRANPAAGLRLGRTVAASPVKETHALTEDEVVRCSPRCRRRIG